MLENQTFETAQCTIEVFDTGFCVDNYRIYCVKSHHHKINKTVTRFGNEEQVKGMIKTYRPEKRFVL